MGKGCVIGVGIEIEIEIRTVPCRPCWCGCRALGCFDSSRSTRNSKDWRASCGLKRTDLIRELEQPEALAKALLYFQGPADLTNWLAENA